MSEDLLAAFREEFGRRDLTDAQLLVMGSYEPVAVEEDCGCDKKK